jgi:hypothetical protein
MVNAWLITLIVPSFEKQSLKSKPDYIKIHVLLADEKAANK